MTSKSCQYLFNLKCPKLFQKYIAKNLYHSWYFFNRELSTFLPRLPSNEQFFGIPGKFCNKFQHTSANKQNDAPPAGTYLSFDLSSQKLKAAQLNCSLDVISSAEVIFDTDLPEFCTTGGVNSGPNPNEFYVQPCMWLKAIDIVLDRLLLQCTDFTTVIAIGGSAQQHGSVYWSEDGIQMLECLDPDKFIHEQIDDSAFTVSRSPIWMDGSTEKQCLEMECAVGGPAEMVAITGSKCYPRFTGPQIRKICQEQAEAYENTKRISLVSSFLASLFIGKVAPIDYADASGMNLFDINAKCWSEACLNACAPDLLERLGQPVATNTIVGGISDFFIQRFGFPPECKVAASTGDNPSALSGLLLDKNSLAVSLGTSDTLMMNLAKNPKLEEGHVLCHPTEKDQYMGLLCFQNGSLVRDAMNKAEAENNWEKFTKLLDSAPLGNEGNMALHFPSQEIIPNAKGVLRWNKTHTSASPDAAKGVAKFSSPQAEIRALIEGQMLHRRAVATDMGFNLVEDSKIIATGGASVNKSILQVMSEVFNAPVYIQANSEAALMGAAYRAKYALYLHDESQAACKKTDASPPPAPMSYHDFIIQFIPNHLQRVCDPDIKSETTYKPMVERYREMARILADKK